MPASIKEQYETDGYIKCIDALSTLESQRVRANFDSLEEKSGRKASQYSFHNIHLQYPWVYQTATHENILNPVKEILGQNIILLDSRFICKYPVSEMQDEDSGKAYVAWHQDMRYWGIEGTVVTAWLAVDDADVENGCMQVLPGTHTLGMLEHETASVSGNLLSANQSIPLKLIDESQSIPCPVQAGQMSLHDGLLVHGSQPNTSPRRRCGFVIRFVSTSAKPIEDPDRPRSFPCTVVVAGVDTYQHFKDNRPDWVS